MTAKLKAKRTSIAMIRYLCQTYATFLTPLDSHYRLPLKGTDMRFLTSGFFMNQFPPGLSEYPIGAVSNFYENLWRYSQLCVDNGDKLLPMLLLSVIYYCLCCWHWQLCIVPDFHRFHDTGINLSPAINLLLVSTTLVIKLLNTYQSTYTWNECF